jgi:hypothetical protein
VHGIAEDSERAWVDAKTQINWLRDILPLDIPFARVLTYGYDATSSAFFGADSALTLQRNSETFIEELYANRRQESMLKHPIIFICHGMGGVLVKKALVYSATRTAKNVHHLLDPCISTYAVLFFGTPHKSTSESRWRELERVLAAADGRNVSNERSFYTSSNDARVCELVTIESGPVMEKLRIHCFWEKERSVFKGRSDFVVDLSSAVLDINDIGKSGLNATHTNMIKFNSRQSSDYRTVMDVIQRFYLNSTSCITDRWRKTIPNLNQLRVNEAYGHETIIFDLELGKPTLHSLIDESTKHFLPPTISDADFVGRTDTLQVLYNAFFPLGSPLKTSKRKIFILYGMGGSGKTKLSSKFAQDYKDL